MNSHVRLGTVLAVAGLLGAGVHVAGAAPSTSHAVTQQRSGAANSSSGPRVQPFVKAGHGQRPVIRRNEQGPGCTAVNPSYLLTGSLYGPPPYSAAVAVTANGTTVSGTNVNASGCDFGIYVAPGVSNVTISNNLVHDAFQVGIMVDSAGPVNVTGNQVTQTGWHDGNGYDPNGVQTGLAIYYLSASGDISNNFVSQYQKNGITANSGSNVSLEDNAVMGFGSSTAPTSFIGQNGFQIYESNINGQPTGNFVDNNWYANPSYTATGYLLCAATLNYSPVTKGEFIGKGPSRNEYRENQTEVYDSKNC